MEFTREPIIESVITAREGYKLAVRSSKGSVLEEYFVDALEIVSFGSALFFRSLERPKSFLVPVTDYEIIEVREARMVLKTPEKDRSIKSNAPKSQKQSKSDSNKEQTTDKKREPRRQYRRKKRRDPITSSEEEGESKTQNSKRSPEEITESIVRPAGVLSSLLPPPTTLISETIGRYKENGLYKEAFIAKTVTEASIDQQITEETIEVESIPKLDADSLKQE